MTLQVNEIAQPIKRINTYEEYQRQEGLPVVRGFGVQDLNTIELKDWARKGGRGAFINLEGTGGTSDTYVAEIAPGGSLHPQHHLFEETVYVLSGQGSTSVWYDERRKVSFEWKAGSLFAIPVNAWYRHFNGSGSEPARFLAFTNAPLLMNLFHNVDFMFNTPYLFEDRFSGQDSYFEGNGTLYGRRILETNFVPDTVSLELYPHNERGAGGRAVRFELAHNTTHAHISEFPVGTYKKAHRHGPDAHVVLLTGYGYSLLWPEGSEPMRFDWQPGSMFVPPNAWFHQHFNAGATPARYLAFKHSSPRNSQGVPLSWISRRLGGNQIDYADESTLVRTLFATELAKHGVTSKMEPVYEAEVPNLPPKAA
jgi:quercetin dioxygenase-like cupin family protein